MKYLICLFLLILSCNKKNEIEKNNFECEDNWTFDTSEVIEKQINDSITQELIDGKIWFEIISPINLDNNLISAKIKNFRQDGSILSEGRAEYYEHPVADYKMKGIWKFYDCRGNIFKTKNFD